MRVVAERTGFVVVDGDARKVAGSLDLGNGVEVITFDTNLGHGQIQYDATQFVNVEERDLEAERIRNAQLTADNLPVSSEPIYRVVMVQRPPATILDWELVRPFHDLWASTPGEEIIPPDPVIAENIEARRQDTETALDDTIGPTNTTFRALRDMTRAEARAWFDANITTDAQLRRLVRWLFLYIVRRM